MVHGENGGFGPAFFQSTSRRREMKWNCNESGRRRVNSVLNFAGLTLALMLFGLGADAQTQSAESKPAETKANTDTYQTLYLTNITQQSEANDLLTDLRNMLPKAKLSLLASQNAISMRGTPEEIQLAQKILSEVDRAKKTYRLTYTITETDGGKSIGSQHFTLIAVPEQQSELRQGSRVPVFIGTTDAKSYTQNAQVQYVGAQVQYVDVGLAIEATVDGSPDGVRLRTRVELSSLAEQSSPVGAQDPVIRQTVLRGTSILTEGKPFILGSLDLPGTTRKQEVEVILEAAR
jgi:type II secretory pathway component GspD/PulD (secretin)